VAIGIQQGPTYAIVLFCMQNVVELTWTNRNDNVPCIYIGRVVDAPLTNSNLLMLLRDK
jgi:hypothetical protein